MKDDMACILEDSFFIQESEAVTEATDRLQKILDAKYEKDNLEEIISSCEHLSKEVQQKLYQLLKRFEELFHGTNPHS